MIKQTIFIAFFLVTCMQLHAQNMPRAYYISTDSVNGSVVMRGLIKFDMLREEPTFDWYKKGYENYKPAKQDIDVLSKELNKYTMVVFMGTWCDDSRDMIPRLDKVLSAAHPDMERIVMYGVDRTKTVGNGADKTYNIKFVPTVILFDGTKEIGRITETVNKSVEADLAGIIKKYQSKK